MPSTLVRRLRHTATAGLVLAFSTLSAAAATEYEKHADGFAVYMGVLPAQVLRGNADASHLATMHGGLPTGSGSHHLVIAIYDERTQRQVEGADVMADVTPLGLGPTRRKLEPMPIGTSGTYGNFYPMPGSGPYTVHVIIHVPGQARNTEVQFRNTEVQFRYSYPR